MITYSCIAYKVISLLILGNGEIDFLDFLQLMTNTERFIEAISEGSTRKGRETLLFDALTEFMKVRIHCTRHQIGESPVV